RIIDAGVIDPALTKLRDPRGCLRPQLPNLSKLDRLRRTRSSARRREARLLAVVTKRALERAAILRTPIDDSEGTRYDAVAAAVADVRLHVNAAELRADDRSRGAGFEAAGVRAVLAHVRREVPPECVAAIAGGAVDRCRDTRRALDELHVPPRRVSERDGVVVREAGEVVAIARYLVPLLARDLACLASDAQRGVGEEGRDHRRTSEPRTSALGSRTSDLGPRTSIRHTSPFDSKIRTVGSSEIARRSLATSPRTRPR